MMWQIQTAQEESITCLNAVDNIPGITEREQ